MYPQPTSLLDCDPYKQFNDIYLDWRTLQEVLFTKEQEEIRLKRAQFERERAYYLSVIANTFSAYGQTAQKPEPDYFFIEEEITVMENTDRLVREWFPNLSGLAYWKNVNWMPDISDVLYMGELARVGLQGR